MSSLKTKEELESLGKYYRKSREMIFLKKDPMPSNYLSTRHDGKIVLSIKISPSITRDSGNLIIELNPVLSKYLGT